ncbi:MAG: recombination-associated protein RdgC [Methylococcaceae bacterium]|nr:MAG: recombination-associated protein RdgC [Methylococcaceae bacterium]
MWFKNLQLYRLAPDWHITPGQLEEQLANLLFQPCGSLVMQSIGWVPPRREDKSLVYSQDRHWLLALCSEQKLLPASVVNQFTQDRLDAIEEQQGYRPGRKQAQQLKEQVTEELLPRAFTRRRTTYVWLDTLNGWLAVNAGSANQADDVVSALHKTLENFSLRPLVTQTSPAAAMTAWLAGGEAPAGFTIERECELCAPDEEKATIRYARHTLDAAEIPQHIAAGKRATRLALTWDDRIAFVLTDKTQVKRLQFLDVLQEAAQAQADAGGDNFFSDFALMSAEFSRFLPDLVQALGGELTPDGVPG